MNREIDVRAVESAALPLDHGGRSGNDVGPSFDVAVALRGLWAAVYRNRLLIASIIVASLLLGVLATMLATPQYQATASVQIDQETTKVLGTEDQQPTAAYQDADRFLQTQVDVLRSRVVAEQVVAELNLAADDRFLTAMGAKLKEIRGLSPQAARRQQVLAVIADNLSVNLPRNSRVAEISFRSPDAALAQQVANSIARNFLTFNLKRKFDQTAYARRFLQQQLLGAKQRLEDGERAMLNYARSVGLIDASAGIGTAEGGTSMSGPRSLVTSGLVSLNTAYANARAARVIAQQRWDQAQRTPLFSLPEVIGNLSVGQLSQQRAQLQATYDQERQRHRAEFPAVRQLGAQIASLDRQITAQAQAVRTSIKDQYDTAAKQESALLSNLGTLKQDTLAEQERSVRYNILKRETDTNRTMYDGLLQRYKEISAEAGISSNNISIVDLADLPNRPVSPRPLLNIAIALLAGLMLSAAVVLVREKFDDAIRSPEDVPAKLGLTFLNSVPQLQPGVDPITELEDARSTLAESYAALRTSLELIDPRGLPGVLLFTSSRSAEGKSTSAYAIARDFARLGKRVVLVDADLRRPSIHRVLGLSNKRGLGALLAQSRTIDEVVQSSGTENLAVLTTGPLPPNPAELLAGASLQLTLDKLRDRFDMVILDGPPVLGLADAVILASKADGVVFIVEANGSHHGQAKAALRRLRMGNANLLGALLTKYDARKAGYGYSYGYYSYDYGKEPVKA